MGRLGSFQKCCLSNVIGAFPLSVSFCFSSFGFLGHRQQMQTLLFSLYRRLCQDFWNLKTNILKLKVPFVRCYCTRLSVALIAKALFTPNAEIMWTLPLIYILKLFSFLPALKGQHSRLTQWVFTDLVTCFVLCVDKWIKIQGPW